MRPERLRELAAQKDEASRARAAGEHAPRERAFRAVLVAAIGAIVAAAAALGFGGELLVEALRPKSASSLLLMKDLFGSHGRAATMALALELIVAGFALGVGAGICLAGALLEQLWIGSVMKASMVPAVALLIGVGIGGTALVGAGATAGRLPWSLLVWLAAAAVPTIAFLAVCMLFLPAFRRGE